MKMLSCQTCVNVCVCSLTQIKTNENDHDSSSVDFNMMLAGLTICLVICQNQILTNYISAGQIRETSELHDKLAAKSLGINRVNAFPRVCRISN